MDRDVFIAVLITAFVAGFAGLFLGSAAYNNAWKRDCEKIGAHVADGVVYVCAKKAQS